MKWLWRTLLPNTPFPACGTANDAPVAVIEGEADRDAQPRAQVTKSWLRKFWPAKAKA
jgi:hypothetical protein